MARILFLMTSFLAATGCAVSKEKKIHLYWKMQKLNKNVYYLYYRNCCCLILGLNMQTYDHRRFSHAHPNLPPNLVYLVHPIFFQDEKSDLKKMSDISSMPIWRLCIFSIHPPPKGKKKAPKIKDKNKMPILFYFYPLHSCLIGSNLERLDNIPTLWDGDKYLWEMNRHTNTFYFQKGKKKTIQNKKKSLCYLWKVTVGRYGIGWSRQAMYARYRFKTNITANSCSWLITIVFIKLLILNTFSSNE